MEVVLRRDATDGFSGWAGYAYGRLRYTQTATGERSGVMPTSGTRSRCTGTIVSRAGPASARDTDTARTTRWSGTSGNHRQPSAWARGDERPCSTGSRSAEHAAPAGVFTPGHSRGSRVQLVGSPPRSVRGRCQYREPDEPPQYAVFRGPCRARLRKYGIAHAVRAVRGIRCRVLDLARSWSFVLGSLSVPWSLVRVAALTRAKGRQLRHSEREPGTRDGPSPRHKEPRTDHRCRSCMAYRFT